MDEVAAFSIYGKGKKSPKKAKKVQKKNPVKTIQNGKSVDNENKISAGNQTNSNHKKKKAASKNLETEISTSPQKVTPVLEIATKPSNVNRKRKTSDKSADGTGKASKKKNVPSKETEAYFKNTSTPKGIMSDASNTTPIVKKEPISPSAVLPLRNNSIKDGSKLLKWLLAPIGVDTFFEKFWEKSPCLVERNDPSYFSKLISFQMIDQMLINNHIEFTKNIDITSYTNGVRETLNPEGRAMPPVVWDHYSNGCSIRLLNPQTYMPAMFAMNTTLQEYFHCMVGSNSYLTPPNSQGFAPHYDDIEAFVLQIEGRKRWKLYNPRSKKEELPRFSSENFSQEDIGAPILEKVLMPGDILYFPRGTIHQACTEPGFHSLHITLSVYQKQSYADLMEKMFPLILQRAIEENVDFRRGLPLNVWHNAGIVYSDEESRERKDFLRKCRDLIAKALLEIPVDQAVDQLAKKYQHEALPPEITAQEKTRTVFGSKNVTNSKGQCVADYEIDTMTKVRLLRANIMRMVEEEDKIRIYYYVDNSKEYCEYEPNYIEIEPEDASSVEVLIKSYPEYVAVNELPLEDDEDRKISIVQTLWERGLLMFDKPFSN